MSLRFRNFVLFVSIATGVISLCPAQQASVSKQQKESEPPEEDDAAKPKEYAFNPLQAAHELQVGEFYMKKGSYTAAVARFTEATRWNPTLAEAYLKLGQAEEKFRDKKAAKEAYSKYLQLAPDAKNASEIKKRIEKL
jgi:tetratricopeptide (TPR) repeat protein